MGRVTPIPPFAIKPTSSAPVSTVPEAPLELADGRRLAVGERLGKGSDASVYRAVVEGAGGVRRVVALKMFDAIATEEREKVVTRLGKAIRRAGVIHHPNVVQAYDFGVHNWQPFALTELVEGASLAELLDAYQANGQKIPPDLALFIGIEMAEALHGALTRMETPPRTHRYVHGDLSAREVLLSWYGEVKVSDFGIRAAATAASGVRSRLSLASRALTLSPEVAQGDRPDARTDIFALGALLRFMLVGPRFAPGLPDEAILVMANEGAFAERLFGPRLPADIEDLLARATRPDPDRRISDPGSFAYELRRAAMALGVGDGRVFLRSALHAQLGGTEPVDIEGPTTPTRRVAFRQSDES
jgi:serine/threonine protein kinase